MSESSSSDPNSGLPPGVPPPPPPKPDLKDARKEGPTYGAEGSKKSRKKKKDQPSHPTDAYAPLRKKRGCGGCCGCLGGAVALALFAVIGLAVAIVWFGPGRFVSEGYKVVNLTEENAVIGTAPSEATFYIARGNLHYHAPLTQVPVAVVAREALIEGDFHQAVSISAVKVELTPRSRFALDLEVLAIEFTDGGMTLNGELKGRVGKNVTKSALQTPVP
jgi:hypothetical protein